MTPSNLTQPVNTVVQGFTQVAPITCTQALGAAGWVTDVDLSATLPAACAGRVGLWLAACNGVHQSAQNGGVRDVDSSEDVKTTVHYQLDSYTPFLAKVSNTRTVDFYRAAADNYYYFVGYL